MERPHPLPAVQSTERIIGNCPAIDALRAQIRHLAPFDSVGHPAVPTVLLHGETGTGKGLMARVIHDSGPRAHGPFIDLNCAAIPDTLLEAELYGFTAGAFTDAKRAKPGLFEAASGGTLFLDEIDALPLVLQGKVLTVIEEKRVRRLGAVTERPVDVKLIAATQAELSVRVAEERFRGDLYQRLAVVLLDIPPLRDRGEDVLILAQELLRQCAEAYRLSPKRLSASAEEWLRAYSWPGNVRELSHLLERVMLLSTETIIDPDTLERLCLPRLPSGAPRALVTDTRAAEDDVARITQALRQTRGNVEGAARLLGWSRKAIRYRMRKYGIARPHRGDKPLIPSPAREESQRAGPEPVAFPLPPVSSPTRGEEQPEEDVALTPNWEQKPVAMLAIELSWPVAADGESPRYEPWTVSRRWEQAIVEKVQGFGGILLQRSPSLLLAVFGLPYTLEQLPQRAVQAALALRQLLAATPAGEGGPELRQAVHWGLLMVDVTARDPMAQVLAIGDTLARPVRLLGHTAPGEILVSPKIAPMVEGWCELQACDGPFRAEPSDGIWAYTVVGLKPRLSPLAVYAQRPLSRFVGRERELAVLEDLLGQAREGRGHVVGVVGEPGVGKSRLCYELMQAHAAHDWLILETSADSYSQTTPYRPVIDLLKAYFQLDARDDLQTIRDKVTDKLLALETTLQPILPALLVLLEVPVDNSQWQALDPSQRRQRTMDAVKYLLLRQDQIQPICLVVENLQWIDVETQAFLDSLVESLPAACLLLLVSYRPEYRHDWGSKTYYTQLRLDPLPSQNAAALLQALLGDDLGTHGRAPLRELTQRLITWTEGNPFFLEESVRSLVETHILTGEPGAYRLVQPVRRLQVPATVQAVLAARIDRLPAEDKRLLQTAAVIGEEVSYTVLQTIGARPATALRQGLARLQQGEFLYECGLFTELAYRFKHALTHEVAYESLQQEHRRDLHACIVTALETLYPDRLAEQVERLAHHALRGEVWDKALAYCRQAGTKAGTRSAYREAVACFEQAMEALTHLPENRTIHEQAIDLHLDLRSMLNPLGEIGRIHDHLREAEILAKTLNDQRRLGEISDRLCQISWRMGDYEAALACGQRALAIGMARGDVRLQFNTNLHLASTYRMLGDYGRAIACLRTNVVALDGVLPPRRFGLGGDNSVVSRTRLSVCLAERGAFAEGITYGEDGVRMAEADDHPYSCATACGDVGDLYLRQGDFHKAIAVLERGMELCRDWQIHLLFPHVALPLGATYALSGRVAEALPLLERVVERAGAMGIIPYVSKGLASLSEGYRLVGRSDEAMLLAQRALEVARQHNERGNQAWALRLLGEIAAHCEPSEVEVAAAHYRQALALAEELGMRPLQAHCRLGLGTLYAKMGQRDSARDELASAIKLYRAMDMTFWLPQAEAWLAQAGAQLE
jgi:DNA-binding NtrC family response regulator/tetratricopeptide (TPR) repeat protein